MSKPHHHQASKDDAVYHMAGESPHSHAPAPFCSLPGETVLCFPLALP